MAPEFHSVNEPAPRGTPRPPVQSTATLGRPYKAIVVLFLAGGLDSWNLLVPHSGCVEGNFSANYEQYRSRRGIVAIDKELLLPINAQPGTQAYNVCTTFGVHPALTSVHQLYQENASAFFANTGPLVRPLTIDEYKDKSIPKPPSLFAHNIQVSGAPTPPTIPASLVRGNAPPSPLRRPSVAPHQPLISPIISPVHVASSGSVFARQV